jgi:N-acetylglucosamine-6-phosphate deacetylase
MSEGFFDLQVNGYGGVDFQQPDLSAEQLHAACELLAAHGVGGFLATIITEDLGRMCGSLRRLVELRERDPLARRLIAGFHIEGPFINETDGYRGAHPRDAVRPADVESARRLLDAAGGLTRIVTLAPERDPSLDVTRYLAGQGVTISAGHCNPTLDELRAAIDAGLSMFTHLGNGCPMQLHRHDNIIQRALALSDRLWITFIGDGAHVPFIALGNYLRLIGLDRCCLVTDAVAPAGLGPGRYALGRWDVVVGEDRVAMAPDRSHFLGAAITMPEIQANLTGKLGLSLEHAQRLTCQNPRRAIGI